MGSGFEGGGTVPNDGLTGRSVKDRTLGVQEFMQLGHPDNAHATVAPVLAFRKASGSGSISTTIFDADCPFPLTIVDVIVECTTANGSGTAKLTNGTNDITDAIACATDKVVARAGTIDDTYSTLAEDATLKIIKNNASDVALVTVLAIRTGS